VHQITEITLYRHPKVPNIKDYNPISVYAHLHTCWFVLMTDYLHFVICIVHLGALFKIWWMFYIISCAKLH